MKAEITINKKYTVGEIDKRIYGAFIEHIGRAVYEGIYEPGHPEADDMGFRRDVISLAKDLGVTLVRYPGGNFVSAYNWEDGTGDRSKRPQKVNSAWQSIETNEVGIDEFQEWANRTDTEVMMAVNLGTRGPVEAQNCVEYCNAKTDTYYAAMRKENGFERPFGINLWCLGNEMGGLGQIGRKTADEYGKIALETAKHMKRVSPDIELSVCGSSHINMPCFGEWDHTVLDYTYSYVDYISIHQYYSNSCDVRDYLARATDLDAYIKSIISICDAVKAEKHSNKTINIAFDEWNVWTDGVLEDIPQWQTAPHIGEMTYTLADALVVGTMLMVFQNNCKRVKIACIAQLVNAIAPIMTEKGGKAWVQTIYYPFMYAAKYGQGEVMNIILNCDRYSTDKHRDIAYIEASAIHNADKSEIIIFAVNRSLTDDAELVVDFENFGDCVLVEHVELYSDNIEATDTKDWQEVTPRSAESANGRPLLKKHSWNMLKYEYNLFFEKEKD